MAIQMAAGIEIEEGGFAQPREIQRTFLEAVSHPIARPDKLFSTQLEAPC